MCLYIYIYNIYIYIYIIHWFSRCKVSSCFLSLVHLKSVLMEDSAGAEVLQLLAWPWKARIETNSSRCFCFPTDGINLFILNFLMFWLKFLEFNLFRSFWSFFLW